MVTSKEVDQALNNYKKDGVINYSQSLYYGDYCLMNVVDYDIDLDYVS